MSISGRLRPLGLDRFNDRSWRSLLVSMDDERQSSHSQPTLAVSVARGRRIWAVVTLQHLLGPHPAIYVDNRMATGEAYTLEVVLPRAAYGTSRHASSKLNNLLGGDRTAAGGSGR
ncbi:hypothetical protein [Mesorhizobium sp. M0500]|uniref:hypothetical protein n=1 Tax=unclassified Mesorhizobium TaxID=325217 RepID=UPI00333CFDE1